MELQGRPELIESAQVLSLRLGGTTVETIELSADARSYHIVGIPAVVLGTDEMVTMTLNVDQTFVPSVVTNGENPDERELGIQVFYAFLETS